MPYANFSSDQCESNLCEQCCPLTSSTSRRCIARTLHVVCLENENYSHWIIDRKNERLIIEIHWPWTSTSLSVDGIFLIVLSWTRIQMQLTVQEPDTDAMRERNRWYFEEGGRKNRQSQSSFIFIFAKVQIVDIRLKLSLAFPGPNVRRWAYSGIYWVNITSRRGRADWTQCRWKACRVSGHISMGAGKTKQ